MKNHHLLKKELGEKITNIVPDKEITSERLRPTLENFVLMELIVSKGPARLELAPGWFGTFPSLLPSETFHVGPPLCKKNSISPLVPFNLST